MPDPIGSPGQRRALDVALLAIGIASIAALVVQPDAPMDTANALPKTGAPLGEAIMFWAWASLYSLPMVTSVLVFALTLGATFAALATYGPLVFQTLLRRLNELGSALPALLLLMLWRLGESEPTPLAFVILLAALNSIETARLLAGGNVRPDPIDALYPPTSYPPTSMRPRRWHAFMTDAARTLRPRLATQAALVASSVFGLDAALAFVGLGLERTPTWGGLVGTAARTHGVSLAATLLATLSIVATVVAIHRLLRRAGRDPSDRTA